MCKKAFLIPKKTGKLSLTNQKLEKCIKKLINLIMETIMVMIAMITTAIGNNKISKRMKNTTNKQW